MQTFLSKIQGYTIGYTNKEEFNILKDEIFNDEIYNLQINNTQPLIFDLGAHIGLSILYFKIKYPNSKIVAFEPNPNVFPLLEENILYNKLKDIELHNIALGSKDETRTFYIDKSGSDSFSTGSFNRNAWSGTQQTLPISVKTEILSKYIQSYVDILKIDIEGAETEVLKELIATNKLKYIRNILMEYHPINHGNSKNIIKLLETNHFKVLAMADKYGTSLVNILGNNMLEEPAE